MDGGVDVGKRANKHAGIVVPMSISCSLSSVADVRLLASWGDDGAWLPQLTRLGRFRAPGAQAAFPRARAHKGLATPRTRRRMVTPRAVNAAAPTSRTPNHPQIPTSTRAPA
jgi:hypothetical protein